MNTMKAAVVPHLGAKLEVRELPIPEPGPGEVLIRMQASGLCHTDIHAANGDWPVKPQPPFIPGHEGVGTIERLGPGAGLHRVGERVTIAWLGSACGHCAHCVSGWETLCESQQNSGYSVNGAWAEYRQLGGADVAVSLATSPRAFEQAFGSLRRGGRLICVALPAGGTMSIPIFDTVIGGKSIIGSIVGTRKDLTDVLALHAAGRTTVIAQACQLEDVNACINDVEAGQVPARLVFTF
jgi:D-arabinose 1-dehydrogenase-like Zn-dependent alcohol dehydrogenase